MSISTLKGKISSSDMEATKDRMNPPEYEPGFGGDDGGDSDFSDIFDDFDDLDSFASGGDADRTFLPDSFKTNQSNNPFGGTGSPFGSTGSPFGSTLGGTGSTFGNTGSPFGNLNNMNAPVQQQPDTMDKLMDAGGEAAQTVWKIIKEMVKSIQERTADDFGYLNRNYIMVGAIMLGASIVVGLIGVAIKVRFLTLLGMSGQSMLAGALMVGTGFIGLAASAMAIANANTENSRNKVEELPDISSIVGGDMTKTYEDSEDSIDDLLDELFTFDDEEDESEGASIFESNSSEDELYSPDLGDNIDDDSIDYEKVLEDMASNQVINRQRLYETFKPLLPIKSPGFSERYNVEPDSEDFIVLQTICSRAFANVMKKDITEIDVVLESASETMFSYELKVQRIKGIGSNKKDEIASELEFYFKDSVDDEGKNAEVEILGDYYEIVITKGEKKLVTFGDCLKQSYVDDFFLDTGNKLPIVVGVNEIGDVILGDAKLYDTMMITGKPRSGKSWYVLSIVLSMMLFNSPEDVQFIICDPKKSNLFNTLALMPHVAGLSDSANILDVLRDIIEVEGERRAKLLADNHCDDIWALKKKGINLPVLYIIIDEVISIKNELAEVDKDKEFDNLTKTLISKLPYLGIRLVLVPHRSIGIIDKTNRTMFQFTSAVRADEADVKETLGISRWKRTLINPGDTAVKMSDRKNEMFVRGVSVTDSDEKNTELIKTAARIFYKMGVDIPDMSTMKIAANRDEEYVREILTNGEGKRIQYDASNVLSNLDDALPYDL